MAYEIDRLEIVIETATAKTNAALDQLIVKLNKVSSSLKKMQSFVNAVNTSTAKLSAASMNTSGTKEASSNYKDLKAEILAADQVLSKLNLKLMQTPQFKRIMAQNPELDSSEGLEILKARNSQMTSSIGLQRNLNNETERLNKVKLEAVNKEFETLKNNTVNTDSKVKLLLDKLKQTSQYKTLMASNPTLTDAQAVSILTKTNSEMKKLDGLVNKTTGSAAGLRNVFIKITSLLYAMRFLMKSIKKAMDFGETINLFQTVFRKIGLDAGKEFEMSFLDRADKFVERFSDKLTLDPEELMKYMANFAQMSNSMGLVTESAYKVSESLTMLGADISSLFNIDIDDAMSKLKSGLAGQIRPMRQLGVDISKTSLQQIALRYGIEDSIETMSAASKVQLRYLAMMEQLTVTMGDMAKTINTPANQLRVLKQQFINVSRSLGQIFIPMVTKLLPYLNAMLIILKEIFESIAALVGYELPDFTDGQLLPTDLGDEIEEIDDALKSLKHTIGGFDELNIISENKSVDGDDILGSGYGQLDEAISEKYLLYNKQMEEQFAKMRNTAVELSKSLKPLVSILLSMGAAFVTMKVSTGIVLSLTKGINLLADKKLSLGIGTLGKSLATLGKSLLAHPVVLIVVAIVAALIYLYTANEKFKKSVNDLVKSMKPMGDALSMVFSSLLNALKPLLPALVNIIKIIGDLLAFVLTILVPILSVVFTLIGYLIIGIGMVISWLVTFIVFLFKHLIEALDVIFQAVYHTVFEVIRHIVMAFDWFVESFNGVKLAFIAIGALIMNKFEAIGSAFINMVNNVKKFSMGIWDNFKAGVTDAWKFLKTTFSNIGNFFGSIGDGIGNVFKGMLNSLIDGVNLVISEPFKGINNVLKSIKNVNILGAKPFGFISEVGIPQIPMLANGGIVDYGQLFVAREAGAELVGSFGGQTGVMNNQQIVEAVSDGVYRAVMAAQSGQNAKPISVTVELDSRTISTAVEQNRRQRGAKILNGGSI